MKKILLSTAVLATLSIAGNDIAVLDNEVGADYSSSEIEALKARVATLEDQAKKGDSAKLEKKIKSLTKKLNEVKAHDAYDNIKFSMDFRSTVDYLEYNYNQAYSYKDKDKVTQTLPAGTKLTNDKLFTSRVMLNMKAKPTQNVLFQGQIAAYYVWGAELFHGSDGAFKSWAASSKASDTLFRVRQAYFVYSDPDLPYSVSVGRRPSSDGFLANHRENNPAPASPLAHITNMEVDAAMIKLNADDLMTGSYVKFVYGRAHAGGMESVYDTFGYMPYAQEDGDVNENVDFFVTVASLYNDGQYNLMGQHAMILDTKGQNTAATSVDAGTAHLTALSLQVDGIGDGISDFLDETVAFGSVARSLYQPNDNHQILGSTDDRRGYSYWVGATIPDMITDAGRFGVEYNKGTQFWTPMTWAEDTAMGSKIAVRGSAIEAYWNFDLFGEENLPSQIRYTHAQHDYTPNVRCAGWVAPVKTDIEADDIRFSVSYRY